MLARAGLAPWDAPPDPFHQYVCFSPWPGDGEYEKVQKIAEAIHDLGIDRRLDPVIAIGGGVCMDIVGFAASIYRRRTPYVRVPTTLMGYVDASVGAKTGVNFEAEPGVWKKNKLGAYLPPAITLLDRSFLATLDERQLANGAAEIVKMAIVKDPELLDLLAAHGPELIEHKFQKSPYASSDAWEADDAASRVLYLAIETMLEELAPNLWEDSLERLVDFGHVFSMELEMALVHQGDEKLFHGEAVAIDMAFSSVLAHVRGHLESETLDLILQTMRGLSLPVYHERFDSPQKALSGLLGSDAGRATLSGTTTALDNLAAKLGLAPPDASARTGAGLS